MEEHSYKTIAIDSHGVYKEKGSRFLSFACKVEDEHAVKARLDELRKKYFDARHHCYAYMIGKSERKFRANDDGEPNHSAGDPILGQIRSRDITDVLIVVVRYFGGVKLGVGGLIAAYRAAAEQALIANKIIELDIVLQRKLTFPSSETSAAMKIIKEFEIKVTSETYGEFYSLGVEVKKRFVSQWLAKIALQQKLGSKITVEEM